MEDIIAEYTNNSLSALYLHGPGIDDPIAMVRDINENGIFEDNEVFFFAKDHLGSVHALTNKQGTPVQRYSYSAYGKTKVVKLNSSAKMIKNPYGFTSREWEEETGDYYYRARYYDPRTGRFLSEDPIGFRGGDENLYRYVLNNPIIYTDPSGKFWAGIAKWAARKILRDTFIKKISPELDPNEDRKIFEEREKNRKQKELDKALCGVTMSCEPEPISEPEQNQCNQ